VGGFGQQSLKNISQPIRVYRVKHAKRGDTALLAKPLLALPDKPSIAVLPFANLSGDKEQEYFNYGITEDIITELSRFSELFVIARNSSFQYKGKSPDIRHVGRELGVRYVLEGSVRRAGDRVRITSQLIDASTGAHRWAEVSIASSKTSLRYRMRSPAPLWPFLPLTFAKRRWSVRC